MSAIMTSREFNQHTNRAQREAEKAPVVITNRGKPVHVLLSYADYQKLAGKTQSALDVLMALDCPDVGSMDFEITPRSKQQRQPVDLSMDD